MTQPAKKPIDCVNLWYSPTLRKWAVCVLLKRRIYKETPAEEGVSALYTHSDYEGSAEDLLQREKTLHDTFGQAVTFIQVNYTED